MLDGGVEIEPWRTQRVSELAATPPAKWRSQDVSWMTQSLASERVPLKRLYGSSFPYEASDAELSLVRSGVGVSATLACGGFSNVWGAALLPYVDDDISDWPIGVVDLETHYRAAAAITGISAARDDLEALFPLYADPPASLAPSAQARQLVERLSRHRASLRAGGIAFGQARLAMTPAAHSPDAGCVYCGLCLYGCPRRLIYNSNATVAALGKSPRFHYRKNVIVERLAEDADGVIVRGRDRLSNEPYEFRGTRAYLAAGAIPTTKILLTSMSALGRPVHMLDSQYYLIPLATLGGGSAASDERLHTLSQVFLELRDADVSPYTVHLQVYTYNDLIGSQVRRAMGPLARALQGLARRLEGHLLVIQGYLHSAHSARIRMELRDAPTMKEPVLDLAPERNPETQRVLRRVLAKLTRHARHLGAMPLFPLVRVEDPGRGFHVGGTFPMRAVPQAFECDVLGRPFGWRRVHAVDATVLPSIPATTITFTVMANAHRIGWETASL
jgi:choline dehydrogenase-like flavoprotein